jgi:Polysaccharide pyruvyl transferase
MNPQKIGVLTFHACINYGSYWQARCLVEGLRVRGHDAVILDHHSRKVNFAEWRCAFRPVLPTPVPKSDYPLYREKMQKFFCAFSSLPISARFDLENPAGMESFDTVVIGSDEVWNLSHPWYSGCTLFYGEGVRARRLISYAASFGNYSAWWGLDKTWADRLRNFEFISVRDENSWWIIKNELGLEPKLVLDPCLQFSPQPEGDWHGPLEPFVAVYGHNFSEAFSREIQRWARSRGYRLVSIGYRNDWADTQWLEAGPHDFAHAIARAEAVATNFFHGCVFSLHNARPFVCEVSSYRSNKVRDLMTAVGGEKHLVSQDTSAAIYDAGLSEPLESEIFHKINGLRQTSEAYLDKALA